MGFQTWLPDVLRDAGLTVHEVSGWRNRGSSTFGPVRGITIHGTGGSKARTDVGEIDTLLDGSTSAPPPIAQLYLGRQGHWWVVASGTCHHNKVGWGGPNKGYGNDALLGIEAAHNNRDDPWPDVQYRSYVRGVAALVRKLGIPVSRVAGHKEHQPGDKPDPTFNMDRFRRDVAAALAGEDGDMPLWDDPNFRVLAYRMEALVRGLDTVRGGDSAGEPVDLVRRVKALEKFVEDFGETEAFRIEAIGKGLPVVRDGAVKGEAVFPVRAITELGAELAAVKAQLDAVVAAVVPKPPESPGE